MTAPSAVLYTQRVDIVPGYGERRNSSDERWADFIQACGFLPAPAVNHAQAACLLAERVSPALILLTGGNNLCAYGGDAPERDATEAALLAYAQSVNIPVLGVCRGMQFLQHSFGGRLEPVKGHVATHHALIFQGEYTTVNSYHTLAVLNPADSFTALASSQDGVIEAMANEKHSLFGIMWHPEREPSFTDRDKNLIRQLANKNTLQKK